MPRLGYTSNNKEEFFSALEELMNQAKSSLEIKRKILENLTDNNLYPYTKFYLREIKGRFNQYWKNHFSTIGLIGMNEAALNLFGKDIATKEGNEFTIEVMDFMLEKLVVFQEETGNNYNLEATPAEGTTYRLARLDKAKFPEIIVADEEQVQNCGSEPFYTNSTHLPVNFTDDMFETLDLQDDLQTKYTGGTTIHLYAGERIHNIESIKNLVFKVCNNYRLPYFTFSPTFSICPTHGYINGEQSECPDCGTSCEIYSRVVGYLRPIQQWNEGKKAEFELRKTFKVNDHKIESKEVV